MPFIFHGKHTKYYTLKVAQGNCTMTYIYDKVVNSEKILLILTTILTAVATAAVSQLATHSIELPNV